MLFVAAVAVLASAAHAFPQAGDMMGMTTSMSDMNQGPMNNSLCCPPNAWQANLVDVSNPMELTYTVFVYDGKMKKEGSMTTSMKGDFYQQTFTDYSTDTKYTVMADGSCKTGKPDTPWDDTCLGGTTHGYKNLRYVGSASIAGKLAFNAYMFEAGMLNITMAFTKDGCLPAMEKISYDAAKPPLVLLFNDVTTNITEKPLLNMPIACAGNSVVG